MEPLLQGILVAVVAIIVICAVAAFAPRARLAGPLVLVAIGLGVALVPALKIPPIQPEWILVGVLPPLLYSAAVNLPAIEFRRDFSPIAGLSVLLVLASSVLLGVFFWLVIPGIGLAVGIALGAILSPTDAVATSIAKRLGIAPRVITMLDGESLLNDATALVLLRTAIVALAGSFSVWGAIGAFFWSVAIAIVVGAVIGWLALRLRAKIGDSAANTAISFTVPFLAYLPTEHLGGSGLVAAAVAGIVTGQGARRRLTPEQRLSDTSNWRTVELVLEGGVFLIMGLELRAIITQNTQGAGGLWYGIWLALAALGIILAVRTGYVSLMLWLRGRRARRIDRDRLSGFGERLDDVAAGRVPLEELSGPRRVRAFGRRRQATGRGGSHARAERRVGMMRQRVRMLLADMDYYEASPLGWRHGAVIVWAGMRGVVTLAAAHTLPQVGVEHRPLLIFVAFEVALVSLMLQGFTLPLLVRLLGVGGTGAETVSGEESGRIGSELRAAVAAAFESDALRRPDGSRFDGELLRRVGERMLRVPDEDASVEARDVLELRLASVGAMRARLEALFHDGGFSTAALRRALAELDADELSLRLRLDRE